MATVTVEQSIANMPYFLDLIGFSEGCSKASGSASAKLSANDGYDVIVAGVNGPEIFTDYSDHPFAHRPAKLIRPSTKTRDALFSTASGRYQVLCHYFEVYKTKLKLQDFSPMAQDLVAIQQIKERKNTFGISAYELVGQGNIKAAIGLCAGLWASLPGGGYDQGGHTLESLLQQWTIISEVNA